MPETMKPITGQTQNRTIDVSLRVVDEKSRTVEMSFSSEQPYDRWYGQEILSHDEGAADLQRLLEVGTVLFTHGRDPRLGRMPIALIEKAWIDQETKKGKALITFDDDEDGEKIFRKVNKGLLKGVSVGYIVSSWEEVSAGKTSSNGRFLGPAYIALKWEPLELSIEPTPADPSVGVGRSIEGITDICDSEPFTKIKEDTRTMPNTNTQVPGAVNEAAVREEAINAERLRSSEITALCREFEIDPAEHINSGATVDAVRTAILEKIKNERKVSPSPAPEVAIGREDVEKFRDAASDALILRGGRLIGKPADGARDLRGMKLRDLAIECLSRASISGAHRMDDEALFRAALTPDSAFAAILSDSVNKSMATAYQAAKPTFQAWTGKGSNPDFKDATHYQISEAGELVKMTQSGEFKFDEMKDNGVSKAVATFGREFGFTRQAMINDDLSVLTRIPEAYVRAASRGINKLVYSMLGNNPAIYDGTTLFHANHKNLGTTGAISVTSVGEGRKLMRTQTNQRGLEKLNTAPDFLIVPAAKETIAQQFIISTADPASSNANVPNIFRNSLNLVVDAELDAFSETSWYLAANPGDIDTIEVTYLNGDDMPKLESQVGFDFLGIKWRIYIDYGVNILDFRGLVKNAGA